MDINNILRKGSKIKSSNLKILLIKEGYKENKCENCGISEWNKLPLVCQLHHIDGDNTNNSIENLQILCPNCHSQTDSYCHSWKDYKKKQCKRCGKQIDYKANYCLDCFHIIRRKVNRPTQQELEDDFKKLHSFVQVGKKYNVSDTCIRKWCKYYNWWPDK